MREPCARPLREPVKFHIETIYKNLSGKEGTIQYGTGNLDGGPPTFYFVEFDRPPRHKVMAISPDWLMPKTSRCSSGSHTSGLETH